MTHLKAKHEAPHMTQSVKLLQNLCENCHKSSRVENAQKLSQIMAQHLFKQSKSEKK